MPTTQGGGAYMVEETSHRVKVLIAGETYLLTTCWQWLQVLVMRSQPPPALHPTTSTSPFSSMFACFWICSLKESAQFIRWYLFIFSTVFLLFWYLPTIDRFSKLLQLVKPSPSLLNCPDFKEPSPAVCKKARVEAPPLSHFQAP